MNLSPGTGGPLVDPDGAAWTMAKRRLDIRVVRRMLRSPAERVLLGESGGFELAWVAPDERPALWERIRADRQNHPGFVFVNDAGDRLLYIEHWC